MAGILAPKLSEIDAAPGGVASRPDTSIANLISNVGGVFSAGLRGGGGEGGDTQQDRDNALIRPFVENARRIEALIESGDVSAAEGRARQNANRLEAISVLPSDVKNINEVLSSTVGRDLEVQVLDPEAERIKSRSEFYSEDARGKALFPIIMAQSVVNGTLDEERLGELMELQFQVAQNRDAELATLKIRREILEEENKLDSAESIAQRDDFFKRELADSRLGVEGLGIIARLEGRGGGTVEELTDMRAILSNQRDARRSNIISNAVGIGLADEPGFDDSVDVLLAPYDQTLSILDTLISRPAELAKLRQAVQEDKLTEAFSRFGILFNKETSAFLTNQILLQQDAEKKKELVNVVNGLSKGGTFISLPGAIGPQPDPDTLSPVISPEFSAAASTLSDAEQRELVKFNVGSVYTATGLDLSNPEIRPELVQNWTAGLGVMMSQGKDISESTFDKTFRPGEFLDLYTEISGVDDDLGAQFKEVSKQTLARVASETRTRLGFVTSTIFSEDYPGLQISSKGEIKFTGAATPREQEMKALLRKRGLPNSLDGVKALANLKAEKIGDLQLPEEVFAIRAAQSIITNLGDDLKYLTKIFDIRQAVSVIDVGGGEPIAEVDDIFDDFSEEEEIIHVTNFDEAFDLPIGATFTYNDRDGNLQTSRFNGAPQ